MERADLFRYPLGSIRNRSATRSFRHIQQGFPIPARQGRGNRFYRELRLFKNFRRAGFLKRQRIPVLLTIFVLERDEQCR